MPDSLPGPGAPDSSLVKSMAAVVRLGWRSIWRFLRWGQEAPFLAWLVFGCLVETGKRQVPAGQVLLAVVALIPIIVVLRFSLDALRWFARRRAAAMSAPVPRLWYVLEGAAAVAASWWLFDWGGSENTPARSLAGLAGAVITVCAAHLLARGLTWGQLRRRLWYYKPKWVIDSAGQGS